MKMIDTKNAVIVQKKNRFSAIQFTNENKVQILNLFLDAEVSFEKTSDGEKDRDKPLLIFWKKDGGWETARIGDWLVKENNEYVVYSLPLFELLFDIVEWKI